MTANRTSIMMFAAVTALWFVEPLAKRTHHLSYGEIIGDSVRLVKHQPDVRYAILFFGVFEFASREVGNKRHQKSEHCEDQYRRGHPVQDGSSEKQGCPKP